MAERWRDLVDRLDRVWQTLRPLGWEADRRDADLNRAVRRDLLGRQSVADLARAAGHPHLEALVRSVAHRLGGAPDADAGLGGGRAVAAADVRPLAGSASRGQRRTDDGPGRSSVLVEALAGRLEAAPGGCAPEQRRHRYPGRDRSRRRRRHRFGGTAGAGGGQHGRPLVHVRRRCSRARPPAGPGAGCGVSGLLSLPPSGTRWSTSLRAGVRETVTLTASGVPTVAYARPVGTTTVTTTHDFGAARPSPASGVAWAGMRSWVRRPAVSDRGAGLFLAGPSPPPGRAGRPRSSPAPWPRTRCRTTWVNDVLHPGCPRKWGLTREIILDIERHPDLDGQGLGTRRPGRDLLGEGHQQRSAALRHRPDNTDSRCPGHLPVA